MTITRQWLNLVSSLCRCISGGAVALDGDEYQSVAQGVAPAPGAEAAQRPATSGQACSEDDGGSEAALVLNRLQIVARRGLPRPAVVDPAVAAARRNAALCMHTRREAARIEQNARQVNALISLVNGTGEPSLDDPFDLGDYSNAILSLDDTRIEPAISADAEKATGTNTETVTGRKLITSSPDRIGS